MFHSNNLNDHLLTLLDQCDQYQETQKQLANLFSSGCFQLALARKSIPRLSSEDCRQDIESDIYLDIATDFGDAKVNLSSVSSTENSLQLHPIISISKCTKCDSKRKDDPSYVDSTYLLSGLPPKALRVAKSHYLETIDAAIKAANIIRQIELTLAQFSQ